MARARPIPDLNAEATFAEAAVRTVAVRAAEVAEHSRDVLDTSDIERVHDMRVATRRLRAALEVFAPCFPKRRHADVLKEVKKLADALGERRDRDVTIAMLHDVAAAMGAPDRSGIQSLVERLQVEQAEANDELAPFVTRDRVRSLEKSLADLTARASDT